MVESQFLAGIHQSEVGQLRTLGYFYPIEVEVNICQYLNCAVPGSAVPV